MNSCSNCGWIKSSICIQCSQSLSKLEINLSLMSSGSRNFCFVFLHFSFTAASVLHVCTMRMLFSKTSSTHHVLKATFSALSVLGSFCILSVTVPIPMGAGTGFMWVWLQVEVESPASYLWSSIISDCDFKFTLKWWYELHRIMGTKLLMSTSFPQSWNWHH